jgi:type II secretory pathway component GspD/PulD (secretin)
VRQADARTRELFRLKNAPAMDVAQAIEELLRGEAQGWPESRQEQPIVVPEAVSNSLLVSGRVKDVEQLGQLIEALDRPPQMVLIQMLIARSARAGAPRTSPAKRSSKAGRKPDGPEVVGLPPGSHFSAERLKREVELGVLDASSAKPGVEELLRALRKQSRLEVLSRPQLMTLDNQPAFLEVGSREPLVRSSQRGPSGPAQQIEYVEVGQKVGVTPRVEPDGQVTMEIDLQVSQLCPSGEGAEASASPDAGTVRVSRVVTITAQTTVSVADGRTVVLGGLMSKSDSGEEELLVVLTAHIVRPGPERRKAGGR